MKSGTGYLAGFLALAVAAEAVWPPAHHPPAWNAIVGLVSCIVVVILAKAAGRAFLQEPEDDA